MIVQHICTCKNCGNGLIGGQCPQCKWDKVDCEREGNSYKKCGNCPYLMLPHNFIIHPQYKIPWDINLMIAV